MLQLVYVHTCRLTHSAVLHPVLHARRAGSTVVTVVYSSGVATLPIRQGAAGMQLTVCKVTRWMCRAWPPETGTCDMAPGQGA